MLKIIKLRDYFTHTAKEDMTVYKVMRQSENDPLIAYAPYRSKHIYVMGREDHAFLKRNFSGQVSSGIHAFTSFNHAFMCGVELINEWKRRDVAALQNFDFKYWDYYYYRSGSQNRKALDEALKNVTARKFEVFECVIPKGAKYYKGVWDSKYPDEMIPNVAADRMTVVTCLTAKDKAKKVKAEDKPETIERVVDGIEADAIKAAMSITPYSTGYSSTYTSTLTTTTFPPDKT